MLAVGRESKIFKREFENRTLFKREFQNNIELVRCFCYIINMESLKKIIGKNLADLRKERKITQLEVAEMFGYTDKAISKWEKGDTLPDVETLYQLASYYGVTLDYLTSDEPIENQEQYIVHNEPKMIANRITIVCLIVSLVWMIASIMYAWLLIFNEINFWQAFIAAVPLSCIVLSMFNKLWGKRKYIFYIATLFVWGLITTTYTVFLKYNLWPLFIIGAPAQISIFLWARMKDGFVKTVKETKKPKKNKDKEKHN